MGTRNGAQYITEQMDSIAAQRNVSIAIHVSDDGSTDGTLEAIHTFASKHPHITIKVRQGPGQGFSRNFLSLACGADLDGQYFAFSDQDDFWHSDKLEAAVAKLSSVPGNIPCVYTSRTKTVDGERNFIGLSPLFSKPPALENALVQSIGGGNTMVFNRAARDLLVAAGPDIDVPSHDWWTYLVVTACGGTAIYDPEPHIDYRQHGSNVIGENSSAAAKIFRIRLLLHGRFQQWIEANLAALERLEPFMPETSRSSINAFRQMRKQRSMTKRLTALRQLGLYRQTLFGNMSLFVAATLNKL